MTLTCDECDELLARDGPPEESLATRRDRHLASCAPCREQWAADAALRAALTPPPTVSEAGLELRLRRRLGRRRADSPGRLSTPGRRVLTAYGVAASIATIAILARLPWPETVPIGVVALLAGGALVTPLVLLDRLGIVLPPDA